MHGVQQATGARYGKDYRLIDTAFKALFDKGKDPKNLQEHGADVVEKIMKVLMKICGPKAEGTDYEGLKASCTGNVILAATAESYKDHGISFANRAT